MLIQEFFCPSTFGKDDHEKCNEILFSVYTNAKKIIHFPLNHIFLFEKDLELKLEENRDFINFIQYMKDDNFTMAMVTLKQLAPNQILHAHV